MQPFVFQKYFFVAFMAADALARDVCRTFRRVGARSAIDGSAARKGFVDELVGLGDFVRRQDVLGTAGAVRLSFLFMLLK